MPTLILSEYIIKYKCIHLLLVNFSYRQPNYLPEYQRRAFFFNYLENVLTRFLFLP